MVDRRAMRSFKRCSTSTRSSPNARPSSGSTRSRYLGEHLLLARRKRALLAENPEVPQHHDLLVEVARTQLLGVVLNGVPNSSACGRGALEGLEDLVALGLADERSQSELAGSRHGDEDGQASGSTWYN